MTAGAEGSVAFDRAAEYYDRTRGLPPEVDAAQTDLLARELAGRGRVLEVGVGTGIVALPLISRGIPMVGVDLSMPMLRRLMAKAEGERPPLVCLGDATSLPFSASTFGGAIVRWVLHLVPDWRRLTDEVSRTLRHGGLVLVNLGGFKRRWEVVDRFLEAAGGLPFSIGLDPRHAEELDAAFAERGTRGRVLPAIASHDDQPIGEFLSEMESGMHSWTWRVPEETRRLIIPHLREWATERFGSLDAPIEPDSEISWRAYDLL